MGLLTFDEFILTNYCETSSNGLITLDISVIGYYIRISEIDVTNGINCKLKNDFLPLFTFVHNEHLGVKLLCFILLPIISMYWARYSIIGFSCSRSSMHGRLGHQKISNIFVIFD